MVYLSEKENNSDKGNWERKIAQSKVGKPIVVNIENENPLTSEGFKEFNPFPCGQLSSQITIGMC